MKIQKKNFFWWGGGVRGGGGFRVDVYEELKFLGKFKKKIGDGGRGCRVGSGGGGVGLGQGQGGCE